MGFGAANNRGLKLAKGKYIFFLNSDTILLNNAVKIFFDYWENTPEKNKIGALGANLFNKNREVIHSYGHFPVVRKEIYHSLRRIFVYYVKYLFHILHINRKVNKSKNANSFKIGKVEYITGADLFVANNDLAYYDERYFLYYEETQLEWNLMKRGLNRLLIDGPQIIHLCGGSDSRQNDNIFGDKYFSFGKAQRELSRIKFVKYNLSIVCAFILKIFLFIFWISPSLYNKTTNFRKEIWKI